MSRAKTRSILSMLVGVLSLLLFFAPSTTFAQDNDSVDNLTVDIATQKTAIATQKTSIATQKTSIATQKTAVATQMAIATSTAYDIPKQGTPLPPSIKSSPALPNPIFSATPACTACQKQYFDIHNCSSRLPPVGVNMTTIVQLLPFYTCVCPNNYVMVDALQQCSSCFRSTGQLAHLNPQFYNVTNQQVKSFKKVCAETANGSRIPNSGVEGLLDIIYKSGSWILISTLLVTLIPFASL